MSTFKDFLGDLMKKIIMALALVASTMAQAASVPVLPAADQQMLLQSDNVKLADNKKLVYNFTRIILSGRRLERVREFMTEEYIQHNPNVETGLQGFIDFFSKLGGPRDIPSEVRGLVSIQAESDLVTLSFVNQLTDPEGKKYTTTWFDMFRVQDGKISEHWDCDIK